MVRYFLYSGWWQYIQPHYKSVNIVKYTIVLYIPLDMDTQLTIEKSQDITEKKSVEWVVQSNAFEHVSFRLHSALWVI